MKSQDDKTLEGHLDAYHSGEAGAAAGLFAYAEEYFRSIVRPRLVSMFGSKVDTNMSASFTRLVQDFFVETLEGRADHVWRHRSATALRGAVTQALANDVRDLLRRRRGEATEHEALEEMAEARRLYFEDRFELDLEAVLGILGRWLREPDEERRLMARVLQARYLLGEGYGEIAATERIEDRKQLYRIRDGAIEILRQELGKRIR